MTRPTTAAAALVAGALAALLAACSTSVTIETTELAQEAAKSLQEQVGAETPPEIDCGDEKIEVEVGLVVECVLTDPSTGSEFDTTLTITSVEGTDVDYDIQVAPEPRG